MPLKREGKIFKIRGEEVRLFPISVLADELTKALKETRTTQTVRKWELNKVIPPAIFRHGQKRLYSMEQIKCICKIAKEEKIRQGVSLSLSNFSDRVHKELQEINKKYLGK